jgi:hypothetical protein
MVLIPVIWNGIFQNFYKSWTVYYDIPIYSYQIVVGSPGALPKCAPYAFYTICFSAFVHAVSIQIWLCRKALHSLKMSHDNKKDHWSVICSEKATLEYWAMLPCLVPPFFVTTFSLEDPLIYYVYELIPEMNNGSQLLACARLLTLTGYMEYARTCVSVHVLVWDI